MHVQKILFVLSCGFATLAFGADGLDKVTKEGKRSTQEGEVAQDKVNSLSDATADIVSEYKTVTKAY